MADKDFYFLRNVEARCGDEYSAINDALQESSANVRFGPPLTEKGDASISLLEQSYVGIYMRREDRPIALRERFSEARIRLQEAEKKLEKIIEKGVENIGYETL